MAEQNINLPYSLEAEQSILGSILIDQELQFEIVANLREDDFCVDAHKHIFSAMYSIIIEGKTVDVVTLIDLLSKTPAYVKKKGGSDSLEVGFEGKSMLDRVGGIEYITELTTNTPSAANYDHYLNIVNRDGILRKLIRAAGNIHNEASQSTNSRTSLSYAEKQIYDISEKIDKTSLTNINENIDDVLETYEKIQTDKTYLQGLTTGFTGFDDLTNGLHKGNLIILAARPSVGKTTLAMNIVENVAMRHDAVCAVFALEMTKRELSERMISSIASASNKNAKKGRLTSEDWQKLWDAKKKLQQCKIFVDDTSLTTVSEILSKCRRLKAMQGGKLDLIVVDHIQLMNGDGAVESRQIEVSAISRGLKMIAKTLDVPVLALSQLSRDSDKAKRKPVLSDLRDSGSIEQDADIVMFIHREDRASNDKGEDVKPKSSALAEIILAKNRSGECSSFNLMFKGEESKFINPSIDSIEEPKHYPKQKQQEDNYDPDAPVGEPPAEDEDLIYS